MERVHLNLSFHNLNSMIENLDIFKKPNNLYTIIKQLKVNDKRGIYLVKSNKDDKNKVLKFLLQVNTNSEQLWIYKFYQKLSHDNFCKIESIDKIDRFYMITQEYIDGMTLNKFFLTKPSKKRVYRILFDLIFALEYIHEKYVVHGDIKPDNIIIRIDSDIPVIIDYDLGKNISQLPVRSTRRPFGTNIYMSPEMINDQIYDLKTDIWSLGMTLYSCIVSVKNIMSDLYHDQLNNNHIKSTKHSDGDLEQDVLYDDVASLHNISDSGSFSNSHHTNLEIDTNTNPNINPNPNPNTNTIPNPNPNQNVPTSPTILQKINRSYRSRSSLVFVSPPGASKKIQNRSEFDSYNLISNSNSHSSYDLNAAQISSHITSGENINDKSKKNYNSVSNSSKISNSFSHFPIQNIYDFDFLVYQLNKNKKIIQKEYGRLFFNSICVMLMKDYTKRPSANELKNIVMRSKYYKKKGSANTNSDIDIKNVDTDKDIRKLKTSSESGGSS